MMKQILASIFLLVSMLNAQVTGLSDWSLYVDPGHSQTANMGVSGYPEAASNLTMALHLKEIFLAETDISNIWTSRSNHTELVSLGSRSEMANLLNADWFHSIHSNAGASTPAGNNVLLLYGESSPGVEKTWAPGGRAVSDIMSPLMAATMRIPEMGGHGSRGDCVFYGVSSGPYLSVNHWTNMPSELSESGFHTIPSHNQLQMNPEYARLVSYSMFWTFLDYHDIARPNAGILTGIISDDENGIPVNGATASVDGQVYTTDSYDSRFHLYTSNPDAYHNGFYFFEGIGLGTHEIIVSAPGYNSDTLDVNMDEDFITFLDIQLTSTIPPVVLSSSPALNDTLFPSWDELSFQFSRSMNTSSVETAFSITPSHSGTFSWSADSKTMTFLPDDILAYVTSYTVEIAGSALSTLGYPLDGNGDG
ncbi:MAG: N-acetylmuramoyl-L-alanine amidase, partial [Candidatus Marinimicrobia bacterium]|nr:N-acetylmuramoyl-L-alanine amidase [Candidatus Neomarinimicrobiota bacterium]